MNELDVKFAMFDMAEFWVSDFVSITPTPNFLGILDLKRMNWNKK